MAGNSPKALFGLSSQRLRGMMVLALAFLLIYLILFERDPPPSFREVAVEIPAAREIDHDEREFTVAEPESLVQDEQGAPAPDSPVVAATPAKPSVAPKIEAGAAGEESGSQPASAAAETKTPEAAGGEFRIQMVALSERQKAEDFAARLEQLLGVEVKTEAIEQEGESLYRVWLGPFASREAAAAALAEFSAAEGASRFDFAAAKILLRP